MTTLLVKEIHSNEMVSNRELVGICIELPSFEFTCSLVAVNSMLVGTLSKSWPRSMILVTWELSFIDFPNERPQGNFMLQQFDGPDKATIDLVKNATNFIATIMRNFNF